MNYLLSEEEYQKLIGPPKVLEKVRRIAILVGKCVHDKEWKGIYKYCDNCPLSAIGKNPHGLTCDESKQLCSLERYYSK